MIGKIGIHLPTTSYHSPYSGHITMLHSFGDGIILTMWLSVSPQLEAPRYVETISYHRKDIEEIPSVSNTANH